MAHTWSGAPGMHCTTCGHDAPLEDALSCAACKWYGVPYGIDDVELCPLHAAWADAMATCPPDAEKARGVVAMLGVNKTRGRDDDAAC